MKYNNNMLKVCALLSNAANLTRANSRSQLTKITLVTLSRMCGVVQQLLVELPEVPVLILTELQGVLDLIDILLTENPNGVSTDVETKLLIDNKINSILCACYEFANEYYIKNDFDYQSDFDAVLKDIVTHAVSNGFKYYV